MDGIFWVNVLMRWLHVASAVVGVGATLMMRFAVLPALERLPNGGEILDALRPGVKRLIHGALGLLFVTGFYNFIMVAVPRAREVRDAAGPAAERLVAYHPVMGMKILLSLVLFGIAVALLQPVPSFHAKRKTWLTVNSILGLVILLLAAFLRRLW